MSLGYNYYGVPVQACQTYKEASDQNALMLLCMAKQRAARPVADCPKAGQARPDCSVKDQGLMDQKGDA